MAGRRQRHSGGFPARKPSRIARHRASACRRAGVTMKLGRDCVYPKKMEEIERTAQSSTNRGATHLGLGQRSDGEVRGVAWCGEKTLMPLRLKRPDFDYAAS